MFPAPNPVVPFPRSLLFPVLTPVVPFPLPPPLLQRRTAASLLEMARGQGLPVNSYLYNGAMAALVEPSQILELFEEMQVP